MHPVTRTFDDEALEREYRDDLFARHQRFDARFGFVLVLLFTATFPVLDYLVVPDAFHLALTLRLGLLIPLEIGFYALSLTRHFQRLFLPILLVPMLAGWAIHFHIAAHARPPGSYVYLVWPALITMCMPVLKLSTPRMLIVTGSVLALYLAMELIEVHSPQPVLVFMSTAYGTAMIIGTSFARSDLALRTVFLQRREIDAERAKSERLLHNVLPAAIAERLKSEPGRIADYFDEVTVLFGDVVGFTTLSSEMSPGELVDALDDVFSGFDDIARRHGLEKIKTIGDAYMVVGGVPTSRTDHAEAVAGMALEMRDLLTAKRFPGGRQLHMRIGIHSGPVVAGVIGKDKFIYDLWGDTVNTASRMESHGVEDRVQVSASTAARLGRRFRLTPRGSVAIKGKGEMETWFLEGLSS
jgi:class 3 adenylate cyclase